MVYMMYWLQSIINPIAVRTAKTLWSFGRSKCNRVNQSKDILTEVRLNILK